MAVKTAKLTGAEAAVTGLDGSIAHIRNDGAGVVLASLKAGITEGADGVLSVPAGTSAALTGISGELHLLGIGSVVIVSNDYAECPFKSAVTLGSVTDEISRAAGGSNLLMNPDFRINQRGKSEYSTGYTVDRWYISTDKCKAAPESDGIRLTASVALASNTHAFWQNLEFPPAGGEYTLSLNVPEVLRSLVGENPHCERFWRLRRQLLHLLPSHRSKQNVGQPARGRIHLRSLHRVQQGHRSGKLPETRMDKAGERLNGYDVCCARPRGGACQVPEILPDQNHE